MSLGVAVAITDLFPSGHRFDMMDNNEYVKRFEKAVDSKYLGQEKGFQKADWDELLGHCRAVTDMPCAAFWRELCDAYPDAKVVLVERDVDKWYPSFIAGTVDAMFTPTGIVTRSCIEPLLGSRVGAFSLKVIQGMLGEKEPDAMKRNAKEAYQQHYKEVRAAIPADRLLDYRLGSGWKPLCDFLKQPIPNEDFPWVNESDALQVKIEEFKQQKRAELGNAMIKTVLPTVVAIGAALLAWRTMMR